MSRALPSLLLLLILGPPLPAQKAPPDAEGPPVIKVAVPATPEPLHRALKYSLLPDDLDLVPGNAAPQWLRAGQAAAEARLKMGEKESGWTSPRGTPLDNLPRDEVRAWLNPARAALRLADRAARFDHCDWEYPPLTIQNLDLPLSEIQHLRTLANLLSVRFRLELREGQYDRAAYTLQTGLAMSRHAADAPILIQNLVGIAITAIMLGHVEEWLSLPGAPDLFWPLTALPEPFVDSRQAIRHESGTLYRSYPQLRRLNRESMTPAQTEQLAEEIIQTLLPLAEDKKVPLWQGKLALATLAARVYPSAKRHLIARGRTPEEVEKMASLQVAYLYCTDQYDETWDDILKWLSLPYWQAKPGLAEADRKIRAARAEDMNVFVGLLMPAVIKVFDAAAREQRHVAGLRCAAAIRLHAARHGGRLPATLKEITDIPLPIDPVTGKGFDDLYKAGDGKAVLDVPPLPPQGPLTGRRYEFISSAKEEGKKP